MVILMQEKSYPNPSIVEAIYEFRFVLSDNSDWTANSPSKLIELLRESHPNFETGKDQTIEFKITPNGREHSISEGSPRHKFSSEDKSSLIQVTDDTLVFNVLGKYPGWTNVQELIKTDFGRIWNTIGIEHIRRCGLRYINVVEMDNSSDDLSRWVHPTDYLSSAVVNSGQGFRLTQESRDSDEVRVILNLSNQSGSGEEITNAIVFDIDCIRDVTRSNSCDEAMLQLSDLHKKERLIFDQAITDVYVQHMN